MKQLYSILIAVVALVVLAQTAVEAAPPLQSWSDIFTKGRFQVLSKFGSAAVLDKETGLVWERSPDTGTRDWFSALSHCYTREVGGRKGWRLPTIEELASLVDTSQASPPLPLGHPFTLTSAQEDGFYWSATTFANSAGGAWVVNFFDGDVTTAAKASSSLFVWCVRGGQGIDGVQ